MITSLENTLITAGCSVERNDLDKNEHIFSHIYIDIGNEYKHLFVIKKHFFLQTKYILNA